MDERGILALVSFKFFMRVGMGSVGVQGLRDRLTLNVHTWICSARLLSVLALEPSEAGAWERERENEQERESERQIEKGKRSCSLYDRTAEMGRDFFFSFFFQVREMSFTSRGHATATRRSPYRSTIDGDIPGDFDVGVCRLELRYPRRPARMPVRGSGGTCLGRCLTKWRLLKKCNLFWAG